MSRRSRIWLADGTYYLLQMSSRHQPLFCDEADYQVLEQLLVRALENARTTALAFCWLPHALHLAVRSHDIPVSRFMQGFTGRYAQHVHRRSREVGHLFARRFQSLLIDPDAWLPALVRFIHHAPLRAGLAITPAAYPHSSHRSYVGEQRLRWLSTAPLFKVLARRGFSPLDARAYLEATPTPDERLAFSPEANLSTRILGDAVFLERLPHAWRPPRVSRRALTLSLLIDAVALAQDLSRAEILSPSRARAASLARALIGWHATQRHLATLSDVARALGRDASTLSRAIARYRRLHPQLFHSDALQHLQPIA